MFFASSDEFEAIDGRVFPRTRALERELKKVARKRRGNASMPRPVAQGAIS